MRRKIKVIQFGLGQIGISMVRTLLKHDERFEVVGCIDSAPDKVRKDIGEFLEPKSIYNLAVVDSIDSLKRRRADIVIHSAVSFLPEAAEQIRSLVEKGYNIITTAEEMFFLRQRDSKLFRSLDNLAKRRHVRVLATGVNPGFVMDSLILMFTAPCLSISTIRAERMVNLSHRRLALQRKLGVGLTAQEFLEQVENGRFGHIGLTDSAEFVSHYLGIKYDNIRSSIQPVVADHDYHGDEVFVAMNHVLGVRQEVVVEKGSQAVLSLRLTMRIDASIEYDAVFVDGDPPVNVVINNGIMGDTATVGLVLNQIENLLETAPGFHDMADMRIPRFVLDRFS
ncbi:MAG: hypothetical protein M1469_04000 [Bacteroidetes bacterium]|nr:hypothetical protein [Bacteroidota bacterium]